MSSAARIAELAKTSTTKDLPIGKPGFRWKSGHRQSWRIIKPREKRQVLKEHQTRFDKRTEVKANTYQILREARQLDISPLPRYKETKKIVDLQEEYKVLAIHPQTVTLTEQDLTKVTPEVLTYLGQQIRDLRAVGQSWQNITLHFVRTYTAHLRDPSDKALKLGLVKNELRAQWNLEAEALRRLREGSIQEDMTMKAPKPPADATKDLPEEWKSESESSEHPIAAKMLKEHLHLVKAYDKL